MYNIYRSSRTAARLATTVREKLLLSQTYVSSAEVLPLQLLTTSRLYSHSRDKDDRFGGSMMLWSRSAMLSTDRADTITSGDDFTIQRFNDLNLYSMITCTQGREWSGWDWFWRLCGVPGVYGSCLPTNDLLGKLQSAERKKLFCLLIPWGYWPLFLF